MTSVASSISTTRVVCPNKWWSSRALWAGTGLLYHSVSVEGEYLGILDKVRKTAPDAGTSYLRRSRWNTVFSSVYIPNSSSARMILHTFRTCRPNIRKVDVCRKLHWSLVLDGVRPKARELSSPISMPVSDLSVSVTGTHVVILVTDHIEALWR
jgi:hypothetical protein